MAGVLLDLAVSLDGMICGPGGADGGLYDWYVDPSDASRPVVEELVATTGAIVAAGLVDEVQFHRVPVLLGDGVPLFDRRVTAGQLSRIRVIDAPNVTHLRYRVG